MVDPDKSVPYCQFAFQNINSQQKNLSLEVKGLPGICNAYCSNQHFNILLALNSDDSKHETEKNLTAYKTSANLIKTSSVLPKEMGD